MPRTKLLASILTLSATMLCPSPAHAQSWVLTCGNPTRTKDVSVTFAIRSDTGKAKDEITKADVDKIKKIKFPSPLKVKVDRVRKGVQLRITFQISKYHDAEGKRDWIVKSVNKALRMLPAKARGAVCRPAIVDDEIWFNNKIGFDIKTRWLDYGTQETDWFRAGNASSFSGAGMLSALDLSGVPEGGKVLIYIGGAPPICLDTRAYRDTNRIERDISSLLSRHPLVHTVLSASAWSPARTGDKSTLDGQCVLFVKNYTGSYAVQVTDPGITVENSFSQIAAL